MIRKEYSFKDRVQENDDASSIFTEHNLDATENSIENGIEVTKSIILAPFNSLEQDGYEEFLEEAEKHVAVKRIIKFKSKLREFDRRYERDNNSKLDNGVYVQPALNALSKAISPKNEEEKGRQHDLSRTGKGVVLPSGACQYIGMFRRRCNIK